MTLRHILDADARAADRHYNQADEIRDGDECPHCGGGRIVVTPPEEDCPRGSAVCDTCGREA